MGNSATGNVAVMCPTCRAWDVTKGWTYANAYYTCNRCGCVWR